MTDIGHNNPPAHLEYVEQIDLLKEEARLWLDGSDITTEAEAEAVAKLKTLAAKLEKDADAARKTETKPLDDQKAVIMANFKPVADGCALIKTASQRALTTWLNKKAAEKAEAERVERERLAEERRKLEAAQPRSLDDEEARKAAVEAQLQAEKDLERQSKQTAVAKGEGRPVGLRTVHEAQVLDYTAFAKWVWINKKDDLMEFLNGLASKEVRATSGNCNMDGVQVITKKVAV